jgi:CRP-like cAMP-binding protein
MLGVTKEIDMVRYFKKGQVILKEGNADRDAYIITNGECEVIKNDEVIATLGKNEIFGELGWLQHIPRSATVKAVSDVTLRVIKEHEAPLFMEHNPKALIPVLKIVCSRMGEMLERMSKNI